jgi:hypothetical protein
LRAQGTSAVVNPQAVIALTPVTGGGVRNLSFGQIAVGGSVDTGPGAETATSTAKWEFTGIRKNSNVTLTFGLPTLTNGTSTLPVVWSNNGDGAWCTRRNTFAVGTCGTAGTTLTGTFNPAGVAPIATTPGGAGNNDRTLTVWVGARVSALPPNTPPGLYTGTLSLTIVVL